MFKSFLALFAASIFIALGAFATPLSAVEYPAAIKHPVKLPPSADLLYAIKAKHSGLSLKGDARIQWTVSSGRFDIKVETNAMMLGKILDSHSEGVTDAFGLAPVRLTEKRFRKPQHNVIFDRKGKLISFGESAITYPIRGGEQDRTSITWQLASIARGAPEKFKPGAIYQFTVAGRRDAEAWAFKVIGLETIRTPMGEVSAIHIFKLPSESKEQRRLDIWLAPSLEWYPARLLFSEGSGIEVDQVLQKIVRRK